jgi:hypothetical protein
MKSHNIWQFKPWWCQPWSILVTGIIIISVSWILLKIIWLTITIGILISIWWLYFLIILPKILAKSGILNEITLKSDRS